MKHPRDVQRLANAVKFSWPALEGEIDPQDLFIMEGLRLFDEQVFDWIRWNRDWLFSEGRFLMSDEPARRAGLKSLIDKITEQYRDQVMQLLASLFPARSKLFSDMSLGAENYSSIVRRRGVGCEAGYDAYFTLYPSPNAVPKGVVDLFMGRLDDRGFLAQILESYIGKMDRAKLTMVGRLLEELTYRFDVNDRPTPTQSLLDALFDVGEKVMGVDWEGGMFQVSPQSAYVRLIGHVLLAWGVERAGEHLEQSFRSAQSTSLCATLFVHRARELGKLPDNSGDRPLITAEALNSIGTILLPKIEKAAADGTLNRVPRVWVVVQAWKYLGDTSQIRAWLSNSSESADFISRITEGFVRYSIGSGPRHYDMSEPLDPDVYDLEVFLASAKKHLNGNELTEDARNRISAVADGIERQLAIGREEHARKQEFDQKDAGGGSG